MNLTKVTLTYIFLILVFHSNASIAQKQNNLELKQRADSLFRNNQFIKALKIYQSIADTVSCSTLDINIRIAICQDYTTGVKNKGADIKRKLELMSDKQSVLYAKALICYSSILNSIGEHQKALDLNEKAVVVLGCHQELDYESIAKAYIEQVDMYRSLTEYDSALIVAAKADSILLQCKTTVYHRTQVPFLENFRSTVYRYMGKYKEALQSADRSVQSLQSINDTISVLYARSLALRGTCYRNLGENQLALLDFSKAIEVIDNTELRKSNLMSGLILNTGNVYYSIGDKSFALDYYVCAKKLLEESGKEKDMIYGDVNLNIAVLSVDFNKFTDADNCIKLAGEIYDSRNVSKLSHKYAIYQLYYALIDIENHNYQDAFQKLEVAKQSFIKTESTTNYVYYVLQSNLAQTNAALGNKDEAISLYKQVIDTLCNHQNIDPTALYCFPKYIQLLNDQQQKEQYQLKYLTTLSSYYFESLSKKSYQTQLNILKDLEVDMNNCYSYLYNGNVNDEYVSKLYETTLLFKEFLTYQHKSFVKDFKGSNQQEYFDYLFNKRTIYKHNIGEVILNDKELFAVKREIAFFEEKLRTVKDDEDEEDMSISHEQQIGKDEAKVEFFSFKNTPRNKSVNDIVYGAFILRSDWETPKVSFLCSSAEYNGLIEQTVAETLKMSPVETFDPQYFNKILYSSDREGNELYNFIWKPLEKHLLGVKKIYLCSVGELNKVAFGALPISSDSLLFDKYKFEFPLNSKSIAKYSKPLFYSDTMKQHYLVRWIMIWITFH
nr:tetratricopeptide repeat protein [uncultured Carboxylicivirga sp.]